MLDAIICIYLFIIGSVFASFFGVIVSRVPNNISIIKPASYCFNCGHTLSWYENIPILSYIILKGECKKCHTKYGCENLIFEIIGGVSLVLVYLFYGLTIKTLILSIASLILLLIAYYDKATNTILDIFWILLLITGICYLIFVSKNYTESLISCLIGFVFFGAVKLWGYLVKKRDVLGTGDVIVVTIMGLFLQPFALIFSILISTLVGSTIELTRYFKNKDQDKDLELAFCPYLCFGFYTVILLSSQIMSLLG